MPKQYKIWSIEHNAWWAKNHQGYIKSRQGAGIYSEEEAIKILFSANIALSDVPNEAIVQVVQGEINT